MISAYGLRARFGTCHNTRLQLAVHPLFAAQIRWRCHCLTIDCNTPLIRIS